MKKIKTLFRLFIISTLFVNGQNSSLQNEEGYVEANGVKHYYRTVGQGEPFILLHGGPGMYHDELYPFFLDFAKNHKVIFYDQRGNGKSRLEVVDSSTFNVELMVEDLEAIRKSFGIEKLNIIGHSWGGLLAMYYAAAYPDHVERLILVDAAPVNTELLIKCYQNLVSMYTPEEWDYVQKLWSSDEFLAGDPKTHNEALYISEGAVFSNKAMIDEYMKAAVFTQETAKNSVALNELATKMKLTIHVQDRLSNITCPTLIINGKDDFIIEEAVQMTHKLIANSEVTYVDHAGHYPFVENKTEFFKMLNDFIERSKNKSQ